MSAIEFVVRGDTGALQRGSVSGAAGNSNIVVGQGQDISLNLQRNNVISYMREGQALNIALVNGETITVQGFFSPDGVPLNQLFVSSGGELSEVQLVAGDGNLLLAQYVDSDNFGKWSPDDDLYFMQTAVLAVDNGNDVEAGMLGVPLMAGLSGLGGAGAAGAAVIGGAALLAGGGDDDDAGGAAGEGGEGDDVDDDASEVDGEDGGGDSGVDSDVDGDSGGPGQDEVDDAPTVAITGGTRSQDYFINGDDYADGIEISGTGTSSASGVLTVGGNDYDFTVNEEGTWVVTIPAGDLPTGEYDSDVSVVVTNSGGSATTSDIIDIDTVNFVTFNAAQSGGDGTVNFAEEGDGFSLTGTTQSGSSVVVSFGGNSYTATVAGGTWSLDVDAGVVAQGEYDLDVSVTSTDSHGNTASTTGTVVIDTVTNVTLDTSGAGGDGTVNADEKSDNGVTVVGTAEAGATVVVTIGSGASATSQTLTATSSGQWSATFGNSDFANGDYDLPVTAVSTDLAGNTAQVNGTVSIDTELDVSLNTAHVETDGIVNFVERSDGVTLTGTADAGARVEVTFHNGTHTVTADADGEWSADFARSELPDGKVESGVRVDVKATDDAGNTVTTNGTVQFDTYVNRLSADGPVEGNEIVSKAEASDGITLTGQVEQGSTVVVTFEGIARTASVTGTTWSVTYDAGEIPRGEYDTVVGIQATDIAGNTAEITDTFRVDTSLEMKGLFLSDEGVNEIAIEKTDEAVSIHSYDTDGGAAQGVSADMFAKGTKQLGFLFDDAVADGNQLIVTTEADNGYTDSTLLVLDEQGTNVIDPTAAGLDGFNIGAIDMTYADKTELTLTQADIEALSSNDNVLVIHGAMDDKVTLTGETAVSAGQTTMDGQTYNVFNVGNNGAQLVIDEDVSFTNAVV